MSSFGTAQSSPMTHVWMVIQLPDGTRIGYEIEPAEVEFRYDSDLEEDPFGDRGFMTFRPVNKRWSWTITTFNGFWMYTPAPGKFSTDQPRLESGQPRSLRLRDDQPAKPVDRPRLGSPVPPAIDRTRE